MGEVAEASWRSKWQNLRSGCDGGEYFAGWRTTDAGRRMTDDSRWIVMVLDKESCDEGERWWCWSCGKQFKGNGCWSCGKQFKVDGGGIGQGVMRRKLFEVNGGGAGAAGSSSWWILDKEACDGSCSW